MKKLIYPAMLLAVGTALFLGGAWYGRQGATPSTKGAERKIVHYVDPMNPSHTSDQPGLAPCGMKMEPVYAESDPAAGCSTAAVSLAPGTVRIGPEKQQLIGVRVGAVEKASVTNSLRLFGRVVPDDRRVYRVNAGIDGLVREVSEVTAGSQVKKDQWLASFSAPDARATMLGFLTAVDTVDRQKQSGANTAAQLSIVEANCRVAADRLQNLGLSTLQIEEIRRTREAPTALRILAPADGLVLAQNVSPGLKFEKGTEWYRIADLTRVWILADVFAGEAEFVKPGAVAQVSLAGQRTAIPARVSEVLPQFDPASRTLKVRLEAENPGTVLRPEMFVDVALPVTRAPNLTIPADAVLDSGLTASVFVDQGDGFFEPRAVETGRRLGDQVEIVKGLELGEQIVTSGNFLLDSESRMKLAAIGTVGSPVKDPVCRMTVDVVASRAAKRSSESHGRTYYFCADVCREQFERNPEHFITGAAPEKPAPRAGPR